MRRVRAAVVRGTGEDLLIEDLSMRDPGPGEVVVSVRACAVCHSDLGYLDGIWGSALPVVVGHEAVGVVEEVGEGVTRARVGERVAATLIRSCGACPACRSDRETQCRAVPDVADVLRDAGGTAIGHGMGVAAFAERALVHESQIAPLPDGLSDEAASLLGCGVLTGCGAVANVARVAAGECVVVVGCGGVGLNSIQAARAAGAAPIVAVDPSPERRAVAERLGATRSLDPNAASAETIAALCDGFGADAVFVAVGHADAVTRATDWLAPGGRLVVLGMPPSGALSRFEPTTLAFGGHSIVGSRMGASVVARDVPRWARAALDGTLELETLVARLWPLDEINGAIRAAREGEGVRQVVVMTGSE